MKKGKRRAAATMVLMIAGSAVAALGGQATTQVAKKETARAITQSQFFCNTKALTPAERARHKELGEKMEAALKTVVETECCPFFDFHIDLEEQGSLLCLRLTGQEGVKEFIRAEFKGAGSSGR